MSQAPASRVGVKIMARPSGGRLLERPPVEVGVDLLRRDEVLQLLQAGEGAVAEHLLAEPNAGEHLVELAGAALGTPAALEAVEVAADLVEADAVAAVVAAVLAEGDGTALEHLA